MSEQEAFLRRSGWAGAEVAPLPGDASTRRYARLTLADRRAMLMNQPQGAETPTAPAGASEDIRRGLGYNAVARLAGADCNRFAAVAAYLRGRGLAAPDIHAADFAGGLVILEDFGDRLFTDVLAQGGAEEELYNAAAEVLARLHAEPAPALLPGGMPLYPFDTVALLAETDLLLDWFVPLALGRAATPNETAEHRALWRGLLDSVAGTRQVFVHRDYHAQNLLWMPEREGLSRVGLIDFQDAVAGNQAYDLVSLIKDARRDVSSMRAARTTAHYLETMRQQGLALDENAFAMQMAVMAVQRNAKIVGIFARLFRRDGKPHYLSYLPRVWTYLAHDLGHPSLTALRDWYDHVIPAELRLLPRRDRDMP